MNDAIKARDLFYEEIEAFQGLPNILKRIFCALLYPFPEFQGFFKYIGYKPYPLTDYHIRNAFAGKICDHADIGSLIKQYPIELAYVLALVYCDDTDSITPPWILRNYPNVINVNDEPNEIDIMMTHRDVYLDFFKDKQKTINRLKSGTELLWRDGYFYVSQNGHDLLVGRISSGMKNKLAVFTEKGYNVEQAHVQFCLYWKGKEDEKETMIFLPELHLVRNGKTEIS